jgi:hypothetical protein
VEKLTVTDATSEITEAEFPKAQDVPVPSGYEFAQWDKSVDDIKKELESASNVVVKASYTEIKNTFTVTVKNGEKQVGEQLQYEKTTRVTVTAEAVEGKHFAYWTLDGEIHSYNKTMSFYAEKSCTLEAVYTDDVVEQMGTASLNTASYDFDTKYLSIVSYLTVPEGATMVQAGIYAASAASTKYNPNEELTDANADYVKKATKLSSSQLTYTWIKTKVEIGDIWYARAYVKYRLADGTEKEVMSERITINAGTDYDKYEKATAKVNSAAWNPDTKEATFVAYLTIPEGGKMVKAGVVASGNYNPANDGLLTVDKNAQYVKTGTKLSNLQLTYTWIKTKVSKGSIWYVRPYVIYDDSDGTQHTVYGNLVKLQAN